LARAIDERLNRMPNRHAPYVGENAFAHKGGIHASAVRKDPSSYEHVPPESVGNSRKILVSDQAGRSNLLEALARVGIDIKPDDARLTLLLEEVKDRESMGYAYDGADASFEVLARRRLGLMPVYFTVERYRVNVERRLNIGGMWETVAEAVVKLKVGDETLITAAEGNGPVNALDIALRKDLGKYQHLIKDMHLSDYRVRILNGGTEAITRVVIESSDTHGQRWCTVGVSSNIIEASFEALISLRKTSVDFLQAVSNFFKSFAEEIFLKDCEYKL
jgi:2-isopropylmalate synthase